jgi:hypothetical protein
MTGVVPFEYRFKPGAAKEPRARAAKLTEGEAAHHKRTTA